MHPGIFFGLALFFGIFQLAGSGAHMFMIYVVGLTGMAVFILLTGIALPKRWEALNLSFQTKSNYPTLLLKGIVLLVGIGMLFGSINYLRDVPIYLNKEFAVVSGKPSTIEEYGSRRGENYDVVVTIKGKSLDVYPDPIYKDINELKQKQFTVHYLPHTKWVIDYQMESS